MAIVEKVPEIVVDAVRAGVRATGEDSQAFRLVKDAFPITLKDANTLEDAIKILAGSYKERPEKFLDAILTGIPKTIKTKRITDKKVVDDIIDSIYAKLGEGGKPGEVQPKELFKIRQELLKAKAPIVQAIAENLYKESIENLTRDFVMRSESLADRLGGNCTAIKRTLEEGKEGFEGFEEATTKEFEAFKKANPNMKVGDSVKDFEAFKARNRSFDPVFKRIIKTLPKKTQDALEAKSCISSFDKSLESYANGNLFGGKAALVERAQETVQLLTRQIGTNGDKPYINYVIESMNNVNARDLSHTLSDYVGRVKSTDTAKAVYQNLMKKVRESLLYKSLGEEEVGRGAKLKAEPWKGDMYGHPDAPEVKSIANQAERAFDAIDAQEKSLGARRR